MSALKIGRLYTSEEIDACLRFIHLDCQKDTPWWPCLVFENDTMLRDICNQVGNVLDQSRKREHMFAILSHMQLHLNRSVSKRVAMLLGPVIPAARFVFESTAPTFTLIGFFDDEAFSYITECSNTDILNAMVEFKSFLVASQTCNGASPQPIAAASISSTKADDPTNKLPTSSVSDSVKQVTTPAECGDVDSTAIIKTTNSTAMSGTKNETIFATSTVTTTQMNDGFREVDSRENTKEGCKELVPIQEKSVVNARTTDVGNDEDLAVKVQPRSCTISPSTTCSESNKHTPHIPNATRIPATLNGMGNVLNENCDKPTHTGAQIKRQPIRSDTKQNTPVESTNVTLRMNLNYVSREQPLLSKRKCTSTEDPNAKVLDETTDSQRKDLVVMEIHGDDLEKANKVKRTLRNEKKRPAEEMTDVNHNEIKDFQKHDGSVEGSVGTLIHTTPISNHLRGSARKQSNAKKQRSSIAKKATSDKKKNLTGISSSSKSKMIPVDMVTFVQVRQLLQKVGYNFKSSGIHHEYCRPARDGGEIFETEEAFRRNLCAFGVSCGCGRETGEKEIDSSCSCWDGDNAFDIHLYVRYFVLRGECFKQVRVLTVQTAKKMLYNIGFTNIKSAVGLNVIAYPGIVSEENGIEGETVFDHDKDLWYQLSRFGLPENCDFSQITAEERFSLEFFISTSGWRADTFKFIGSEKMVNKTESYSETGRRLRSKRRSEDTTYTNGTDVSFYSTSNIRTPMATGTRGPKVTQPINIKFTPESRCLPASAKKIILPRVSICPAYSIPVFEGTANEKLRACLEALKLSHNGGEPSIPSNINSKFAFNIGKVKDFVKAVFSSECRNGGEEGVAASIYICGVPGIGKTSGVRLCCEQALSDWNDDDGIKPSFCILNAVEKSWKDTLNMIESMVGLNGTCDNERVCKKLKSGKHQVLLVIDEIDYFVSNGHGSRFDGLTNLLTWANDSDMHFALIGISNSMNDQKAQLIKEAGEFKETIMFSAYSEAELFSILEKRVGHSVIDPVALDLIAKKVGTISGDARKALEIASSAVQLRLSEMDETSTETLLQLDKQPGPLVVTKHVALASKHETSDWKKRIQSQPHTVKIVLCVLTSLSQGGIIKTTLGMLKNWVTDCLDSSGLANEMLSLDDFVLLLGTLADNGLIRAPTGSNPRDVFHMEQSNNELFRQPVYVGKQQEDVEKALDKELKQPYFQNLRRRAAEFKPADE